MDDLNLLQPTFDSTKEIFVSKLQSDDNSVNIKNISFKLLNVNGNILELEFLCSSSDFYLFLLKLDDVMKSVLVAKWNEWFGGNLNDETLNNLYKLSVTLPTKIPSLPYFKCCITDDCKILQGRKKMTISDLKHGMQLDLAIIIDGIQYNKNKCNMNYNTNHIKIVNEICQSFESLFENNENEIHDLNSETNDITASVE